MIINVNSKETLNTYATANIKVISTIIQKRRTKNENASCVTHASEQLEGKFRCMVLKLGLGFYATPRLTVI